MCVNVSCYHEVFAVGANAAALAGTIVADVHGANPRLALVFAPPRARGQQALSLLFAIIVDNQMRLFDAIEFLDDTRIPSFVLFPVDLDPLTYHGGARGLLLARGWHAASSAGTRRAVPPKRGVSQSGVSS